ncbi:MAG: response regulator [Lachnospiraceae bacterium]|nr:response regulator [Lachnospiraceae bacterium]MEE1015563.1 response regulator [Lachnospiraceae bacterium]
MYKVLLVDDEALIREAISENIQWEEMGFAFMGACENGKQAIEMIEKEQPDLLLTDINMPFVDGMDLTKYVYENHPDTKVIIISGFDEFEYAKNAVKYQVLEYILKPITPMEFSETLLRVKKMFDERRESQRDMKKIRSAYVSNLPTLQGRYLHHLLNGTVDYSKLSEKQEDLRLNLDAHCYNTALVEGDSLEPFTKQYANVKDELALFAIYNITAEIVSEENCGIVFQSMDEKTVILFMGDKKEHLKQQVKEVLPKIRQAIEEFLQIQVTIAVGKNVSCLEELPDSFAKTKSALEYKFMLGGNQTIEAEEYEEIRNSAKYVDIFEWASRIATAIRTNKKEDVLARTEEFMAQIKMSYVNKNRSIVYAQNLLLSVLNLLEMPEELEEEVYAKERAFVNEIYEFENLDALTKELTEIFDVILNRMSNQRDSYGKRQALLALEYIDEHYADSSITLNSVCNALAMSTSYFSSIFKNYTGETFIEALTKKRIEKAKILLEQTNKKTYEIAEQVGYSDAHYFSVTFKKVTGKTPTEYAKGFKN